MLVGMMRCSYCGQQATTRIAAEPERVCSDHALEFWTGLLAYAKAHSNPRRQHEASCACTSCEELSAAARRASASAAVTQEQTAATRRAMAVAAAGPSPFNQERFQIRLAS